MAAPRGFPLLVEGSWGPDPPKNLSIKLQMYFQSTKRSGGGECEVHQEPGSPPRFRVLFFPEDVRQRVLERQIHELTWAGQGPFQLTLSLPEEKLHSVSEKKIPTKDSNSKEAAQGPDVSEELDSLTESSGNIQKEHENVSSSVAFENLQADVSDVMITLLVENVSGLCSDDFRVEIIQDFGVAVVTFLKCIDTMKFVDDCSRYQTVKQLELSPRLLEATTTIRVENLPPGVDEDSLKHFFESPFNGGGRIDNIECFPEESSALIKFSDRKVLDTIMTKKLNFHKMPLSVFPYYPSLGIALYGNEKPLIKLPASFRESLELPLWRFFQKNRHLIEEVNNKMRQCHCELTWSQPDGQVIIWPAASLVNQGRRRIRNWQKDASTELSSIRLKYKVSSIKVNQRVWDAVPKHDLKHDKILIEFDALKEIITLAGKLEDVQNIKPQIKELVDNTMQKIKKEEEKVEEVLSISPEDYFLLCHSSVPEQVCKDCPDLEVSYNKSRQQVSLRGPPAAVYKAKSDFQEKMYSMIHKNIKIPLEILHFLQQVDYKNFSKSLFGAQKLLAVYKLEGTTVLLTSSSSQVLLEAEKHLFSALSYKYIVLENQEVLKDKKWQEFTCNLQKKHNSSSCTFFIKELLTETPAKVLLTGCVKVVNEIHQLLLDFLGKHMRIERLIEAKHSLVIDYIRLEKKPSWLKLKKENTEVIFHPEAMTKGILVVGPKAKVLEGVTSIQKILDSIHVENVCIDKPGARQFFQDKSQYCKGEVKRQFGCFIELQDDTVKQNCAVGQKCCFQVDLAAGVTVIVQQCDLSRLSVDVAVNAANENLCHYSGLAAVISKAAGPELQADCEQIIKKCGKLSPGSAAISKAGKLPYRHVIHAVGPRWNKNDDQKCMDLLKNAVKQSLLLAEKHRCRSIAIPAVSSGIFGFPIQQCTETIVMAIKEDFQSKQPGGTLKKIYLVDIAEQTVQAFAAAVKTLLPGTQPASLLSSATVIQPQQTSQQQPMLVAPGGLRILMVTGELQDAKTDAVVNSIPPNLFLGNGPLSRALLERAGPELQQQLKATCLKESAEVGTVLRTDGFKLHCRHVLHVVAPHWKDGNPSSYKTMEGIIRRCLDIAEDCAVTSIAFPAIGTGNLQFPKTVFAKLIISEVLSFSTQRQLKTLQEVHIMLYPKDHENIKAFSDEFERRANGNPISDNSPKSADTQGLYGSISSPNLGVHEMKIGPITFQVASGDITKEAAHVIVNSTSKTFDLKSGVSKAILECAGKDVEMECSLQAQQSKKKYIVTQGGLLMCKNIIHVVGGNDVKESMFHVLEECEKRNYSSICLPAIGTGNAQQAPDTVSEAILDAVQDFVLKGLAKSVKKVKVVVFLPEIQKVFYDSMKKKEGSPAPAQPSMISKLAGFFGFSKQPPKKEKCLLLEKKTESTNFQVCGENASNVKNAISWLQNLIEQEQVLHSSKEDCIRDFDEKEYAELNELQKKLNITISLDPKIPEIRVSGLSRDVMQARDAVEGMIKRVRSAKEQDSRADYLIGLIQWQYSDQSIVHCFDKMTNLQLEDAKKDKKNTIIVKINSRDYTVHLDKLTAVDKNGHTVIIERHIKPESELPEHWSPMKQNLLVVELPQNHQEYNLVARDFNNTCSQFTILKIERIQNTDLWNSYQAKKKTMDAKNGQIDNEKRLFHGTDVDSVPHVNANGFNRSYAGKNATAYGKGTYFAVNAYYSANDTYSRPDAQGRKHMYYVRVLTGVSTLGQSSYLVPPPKSPQNVTDLYDTVTDNVKNPSLYVVFYDYQAYPEYLITFKR
ncbi:protein mono-ADP-ribosyltransferase PARP14 [Ochotona princeps]|uniref:protein mono-ADP-ribosyltransferase PARP14 n=1 Tax=Ochotona princeps TaxID=9978 RepID=UPI00271549D3|nr:protein mono-ADP-ribosyltransferase PARP14 [Ochotona princeps]